MKKNDKCFDKFFFILFTTLIIILAVYGIYFNIKIYQLNNVDYINTYNIIQNKN